MSTDTGLTDHAPTIQEIRTFLELHASLNITRAAEGLHLSQSQVSRILSRLESKTGKKLFHRSTSGLSLTSAGEHFLRFSSVIATLYADELRKLSQRMQGQRGELRVSVLPSVAFEYIGDWSQRFHAEFPEATLTVSDAPSGNAVQSVLTGESDVAISACIIRSPNGSEHHLFDGLSQTNLTPLFTEHFSLVTPEGSSCPLQVHWEFALRNASVGFTDETSVDRSLRFIARAEGLVHQPDMRTNSPLTVAGLIESGRGFAIVPQSNLGIMAVRATKTYPLPGYQRVICAVSRPEPSSPLVQPFIDAFRV